MTAEPEHGWHGGPRDRRKAAPSEPAEPVDAAVAAVRDFEADPPEPLDLRTWPCLLCSHGHYPAMPCGVNGCDCRG